MGFSCLADKRRYQHDGHGDKNRYRHHHPTESQCPLIACSEYVIDDSSFSRTKSTYYSIGLRLSARRSCR